MVSERNTLVLMLTLTNDLTDSSYAQSDLYFHCTYSATSAFNEAHQRHHGRTHIKICHN